MRNGQAPLDILSYIIYHCFWLWFLSKGLEVLLSNLRLTSLDGDGFGPSHDPGTFRILPARRRQAMTEVSEKSVEVWGLGL